MDNRNVRLELKFRGSVLDARVTVNSVQIGKWDYDKVEKFRYKDLESYSLGDVLDIEIITKGKNGAAALLEVIVEGQDNVLIESVVEKGITQTHKTIIIGEKDE